MKSRPILGLLALAACAAAHAQAPAPSASGAVVTQPPVRTTMLPAAPAPDAVRVLLVADRETTLSSPVTARIKMLHVTTGLQFAAGQVLVSFDCEEPQARLAMAQAELAGAVEAHEAKIRMRGLDQASEVEVALAASAAAKARGQVDLSKAQVAQCTLTAPWAGRVAKVHVRTHMSVTPGQPMVDLVKGGPLRLRLNAPSRLLPQIKAGSRFELAIDDTGRRYEARVLAVNGRVDPVSQTIEVEAGLDKAHADLLPGMSGTANLGTLH